MNAQFNKQKVHFQLDELKPLSWLASAIDFGACWFFGRCIWRVQVSRARTATGVEVIIAPMESETLDDLGRTIWSSATKLRVIYNNHQFPERLTKPKNLADDSNDFTVINQYNLDLDHATVGLLAYQLGDISTDFFKRGATLVTAQYSHTKIELLANLHLNDSELTNFANPDVLDYQPGDHVGKLPWSA